MHSPTPSVPASSLPGPYMTSAGRWRVSWSNTISCSPMSAMRSWCSAESMAAAVARLRKLYAPGCAGADGSRSPPIQQCSFQRPGRQIGYGRLQRQKAAHHDAANQGHNLETLRSQSAVGGCHVVPDSPRMLPQWCALSAAWRNPSFFPDPQCSIRAFAVEIKTNQPGKEFLLSIRAVPPYSPNMSWETSQ